MSLTKAQALEMFESDHLIGIGMEARLVRPQTASRKALLPTSSIATSTTPTSAPSTCTFYASSSVERTCCEGRLHPRIRPIYDKIRETVELGGTGVLMQGGLIDLKIHWHEKMLRGIKDRFPKIRSPLLFRVGNYRNRRVQRISIRDTILRLRDAGLDRIPGGAQKFSTRRSPLTIVRAEAFTEDWINVHRTAHQIGMRTTATMMFGVGENL